MIIELRIHKGYGAYCANDDCKKLPEYVEYICAYPRYNEKIQAWDDSHKEYCIKKGSTCAVIMFKGGSEF